MKVKILHPNAIIPTRAHDTDAGLDMFTIENGVIQSGQDAIVKTGIAISLPHGWAAIVKEKSGRATKNKLTVGACVIDSGYRGEILIHLFNNGSFPVTYNIGEKIAQIVVVPVWTGSPMIVDELDETPRGEGRFGSTGLNKLDELGMRGELEPNSLDNPELDELSKALMDGMSKSIEEVVREAYEKVASMPTVTPRPKLSRKLDTPESREFWDRIDRVARQTDDWPQWKKDAAMEWLDINVRRDTDHQHNKTMSEVEEEERMLREVLEMNGMGGKPLSEVIRDAHERVETMPEWKTKGFDQRPPIRLKKVETRDDW